jgi:AcrR family transcriptional regulator
VSRTRQRGLTAAGKRRHQDATGEEPGDPRVARSRAAVLQATLELLGEVGHAGTTVEAIAERSGVAKTTIYRHWPSRAPLLFDAFHGSHEHVEFVATGDVRADLVAVAQGLATKLRDPRASRIMVTLLDAAESDPELAELSTRFTAERRAVVKSILDAGVAAGELDPDLDTELGTVLLGGPLFYLRMMLREPADDRTLAEVIDTVLDGLRRRDGAVRPVRPPRSSGGGPPGRPRTTC